MAQGTLTLPPKDAQSVQKVIDYKLGADKVKAQRKMLDTNKIEVFHNCVFRLCPKSMMQKKTRKARNFNAALIDSVQLANLIEAMSKSAGYTLSFFALLGLRSLQNRINYDGLHRRTKRLIKKRYECIIKKLRLNNSQMFQAHQDHKYQLQTN